MKDTEREIKILIVDDQTLFAEGLKTILESRAEDMDVVGIASDGNQVLGILEKVIPDIILMDIRMPGMDGVETVKRVHQRYPAIRIVMLTTFDDDEYVKTSLLYGAIGYLLKNRPPVELIASIRAVKNGVLQIDPAVSKALVKDVREREINDDDFIRNMHTLTAREREVLRLLIQAFDNKGIAAHLNIMEQTVRNYISAIYSKLGIVNRIEIMKYTAKMKFYLDHY